MRDNFAVPSLIILSWPIMHILNTLLAVEPPASFLTMAGAPIIAIAAWLQYQPGED